MKHPTVRAIRTLSKAHEEDLFTFTFVVFHSRRIMAKVSYYCAYMYLLLQSNLWWPGSALSSSKVRSEKRSQKQI